MDELETRRGFLASLIAAAAAGALPAPPPPVNRIDWSDPNMEAVTECNFHWPPGGFGSGATFCAEIFEEHPWK